MRNLKKMLSLVMALAMIASFMVVGASAADFTDAKDITNTEAVNMLAALGVIKGRDTGAFDPTGTVTRAEMAKMICVVMNGGKDPNLTGVGSFPDTKTHWAAGYIEYCKNMRIVAGSNDGNFYPDKTVTGTEAAKMILMSLGYDAVSEKFSNDANWETNINVTAGTKGLYSDLAVVASQGLSRDNAAQMIYNGLEANMVSYKMIGIINGNGVSQSYDLEKTLLAEKFGVVTVEGIVVANEYASLASSAADSAKDAGKTQISVTGDEGVSGTYDVGTTVDMLGQSVTMYIKYKNAGSDKDATVFGQPVLTASNKIYTTTDASTVAESIDDNDVSLASNIQYFSNFEKVSTLTPVKGGTLTLIDNDNDDEIEYAIYVEYLAGIVSAYSTKDNGSIKITSTGATLTADKSKNVIGFENVAKDDYVLAVQYGGKIYVEKPETITGNLDAYSTSKGNIKVDGTAYDNSGIKNNPATDLETIATYAANSAIGLSATFYLDKNGYVLSVGEADEANLQYAVLLAYENKATSGVDNLGSDGKVKLLLSDGTKATYTVATLEGAKLTTTSFAATDIGNIYSYTLNTDNAIRLKKVGDDSTTSTTAGTEYFLKGKSSIKDATSPTANSAVVTANTVFLYDNAGTITRFVGKNNAPDLKSTTTGFKLTLGVRGGEAKLVYVATAPADSFDGNYVYVYNTKVSENKDGYVISVLLDGKKTDITVSSDSTIVTGATMTIAKGVYAYSKDSSDIYTLNKTSTDTVIADYVVIGGTATIVKSDYIILDKGTTGATTVKEFAITKDTITAYSDSTKNSAEEDAVLSVGDKADVVINDDGEVVYIFVTDYAVVGGGGGGGTVGDTTITLNASGSNNLDLVVTLANAPAAGTNADISAQFEVSRDGGKTWTKTGTAKTATITGDGSKATETIAFTGGNGYTYRAAVTVTLTTGGVATTIVDAAYTNEADAF